MKSCMDFNDTEGRPCCCDSCHDDEEQGFDEFSMTEDGKARLCCSMLSWYDSKGNE